jgi:hypothetical protein
MLSATFGVPAVTIWLVNEDASEVLVGGSTVWSNPERDVLEEPEATGVDFVPFMRARRLPMGLDRTLDRKAKPLTCSQADDQDQVASMLGG